MYHRPAVFEDDDSSAGDEFVICSNCGARIKATRERCLRCFEPLHVDHSELPIWRTLNISDQTGVLIGTIALIAVGALIWVLWTTAGRTNGVDTEAKPVEHQNQFASTPPAVDKGPQNAPDPRSDALPAATPSGAASPLDSAPAAAPAEPTPTNDSLDATRAAFEKKLEADPNDPVALDGLGLTLQTMGKLPEALAAFKRATEVAPRNTTARVNLANIEARLGQWDKAVVDYRVAAGLLPNDFAVHYNYGLALQHTRDDAGAITELETATELVPREAVAHRALAASLERVGRNADAARSYQRYLELAPDATDAGAIRDRLQRLPKL